MLLSADELATGLATREVEDSGESVLVESPRVSGKDCGKLDDAADELSTELGSSELEVDSDDKVSETARDSDGLAKALLKGKETLSEGKFELPVADGRMLDGSETDSVIEGIAIDGMLSEGSEAVKLSEESEIEKLSKGFDIGGMTPDPEGLIDETGTEALSEVAVMKAEALAGDGVSKDNVLDRGGSSELTESSDEEMLPSKKEVGNMNDSDPDEMVEVAAETEPSEKVLDGKADDSGTLRVRVTLGNAEIEVKVSDAELDIVLPEGEVFC